jgi:S1-C subfamily serine protease
MVSAKSTRVLQRGAQRRGMKAEAAMIHLLRLFRPWLAIMLVAGLASVPAQAAAPSYSSAPQGRAADAAQPQADSREAQIVLDALDAVVRLKIKALPEARSARSLGLEREGSGVVLRDSGLVLTIGYLILESESIEIIDYRGKPVPGTLAGYDHATGFGLVRPAVPLAPKGIELGNSGAANEMDRAIFATFGGKESASVATVASKRRFAGYWEYLIDDAIFTVPARGDHSGAALISREGKLLGIGSLFVMDAAMPNRRSPGNMFVPIDLFKPIYAQMSKNAETSDARRPWIGLSTQEVDGRLFVLRVQEEGPAERAGLKTGDIILSIQGESVNSLEAFYKKLWGLGRAGAPVPLKVLQGSEVKEIRVESINRMDFVKAKPAL